VTGEHHVTGLSVAGSSHSGDLHVTGADTLSTIGPERPGFPILGGPQAGTLRRTRVRSSRLETDVRTRIRQAGFILAALALTLTGCASATATRSPEIAVASPGSSVDASPEPSLEASASAPAPSASVAAPTPSAAVVTSWTKPVRIENSNGCGPAAIGIDSAGRYHLATTCSTGVRYYVSPGDGTWSMTDFAAPTDRLEVDPKLAFEGSTVYLAYTRLNPASCGPGGDDGVYYRTRVLPDGAWSGPVRLGPVGDGLQAFREDGGTILATVKGSDGYVYYEALHGSDSHRYLISGALQTALRVGNDGAARVAYAAAGGIRLGRFNGSGFSTTTIPGSKPEDSAPVLALDAHDSSHVLWNRYPYSVGCEGPDAPPDVGTYYATNASGTWKSERITSVLGSSSLQVDDVTGRVHVLVANAAVIRYYTKAPNGSWTTTLLASGDSSDPVGSGLMARDPARGALLTVWDRQGETSAGIYFATKG